jgi:WD40 repeat protein
VVVGLLITCALAGSARPGDGPRAGDSADREAPRLVAQLGHTRALTSAVFSPDGRQVLTASWDGTARLWETETGREVCRRFEGHAGQVYSAVFSSDGRHILTASGDGTARLWDAEMCREIRRYEGHAHFVTSAVFSSDGRHVLTASCDRTARL